jgi:hypothetical protein
MKSEAIAYLAGLVTLPTLAVMIWVLLKFTLKEHKEVKP